MLCWLESKYVNSLQRKALSKEFYDVYPERRREISDKMHSYLLSPQGRAFVLASGKPKPVRCVETGVMYPSQQAAEKATGFTGIHRVCNSKTRRRLCGGYHWEYVNPEDRKRK